MTPQQLKTALRLYKRHQTDGAEFRDLAQALGMNTAELTSFCWHVLHQRRKEAERCRGT